MLAFFKKRKENKLMQDAMEIIGKALILERFNYKDATKISAISMDILLKTIGEIEGHPWVLAVRGAYLFRAELIKDNDDAQEIIDVLESIIQSFEKNAYANAKEIDKLILDSIYKSL